MDRRVEVRLLQTVQTSLQSSYEALPQIVHRADELIRHGLVQANHYQLLDLVDARFDLLRCDGFSVCGYDDVYSRGAKVSQVNGCGYVNHPPTGSRRISVSGGYQSVS